MLREVVTWRTLSAPVRPKSIRLTYYKLIIRSKSASATATVLSVDLQVRYTGNVK